MNYNLTMTFRLYPNSIQKELLFKNAKANQCLWNAITKDINNSFKKYKKAYIKSLRDYKRRYGILNAVNPNGLFNTYSKIKELADKNKFPCFKTNDYIYSFKITNLNNDIIVHDNYIDISLIKDIKIKMTRMIPDTYFIKYANVKIRYEKFYVLLYFECEENIKKKYLDIENSIGLDFSLTNLYVDSNGEKGIDLSIYEKINNKINKIKNRLNRKKNNSIEYQKLRKQLSLNMEYLSNFRRNILHNLSTKLSEKYDLISVENLELKNMSKRNRLNKSTNEKTNFGERINLLGFETFLYMLDYKMKLKGKKLVVIDKLFPSSQKCSQCGNVDSKYNNYHNRVYECEKCGLNIDRDINAAINIKNEGKRLFIEYITKKK